jgi:hypothetical protein
MAFYTKQIFRNFPFFSQLFLIRLVTLLEFCHPCRASGQEVTPHFRFYSTGRERAHVECSVMFWSRNMRREVHIKPKFTVRVASLLCYFYVPSTPGVSPCKYLQLFSSRSWREQGKSWSNKSPAMILCVVWREYPPDVSKTLVVLLPSGLSSVGLRPFN